ncbi:B4GALNT2 [Branchiostoma lanceolatum]|uniref:ribonuclease H n=1 Tax=Branchiostoma lanceolatum TaxID=7740 RepID=A0A8K0EX32_BRALA|nr:B4GALNT2 [Branchiostoma lanceolatum]
MATANRAPKQWCLTKKETINSFENWRANQIYVLSLDPSFTPFLADGVTWQKRTAGVEHRGYTNDGEAVPEAQRRTAAQKAASLELMLGQVANFCPVISRNRIVKASTSLTDIWQAIRLHFGFQSTGGYFLDIAKICLEPNERPEDLYQRLTAAVDDNLLTTAGGITHHGELVTSDEEVSPSLENMVVLLWLQMLHPGLPAKVKQRYGAELRNKTLSSIKPEISLSVDTLLAELQDDENVRSLRLEQTRKQSPRAPQGRSRRPKPQSHNRACPLCKQAGRSVYDHFLSVCPYLPEQDKKYMVRTRAVEVEDYSDIDPSDDEEPVASVLRTETSTFVDDQPALMSRVTVRASPHLEVFHNGQPVNILLDSGAESSMIRADEAKRLGLRIHPNTSQTPSQADGGRMAGVLGECRTTFYRRKAPLRFDALVVSDLASPIIAGSPFLETNGFTINFKTRQIHLADGSATDYSSSSKPPRPRIHRITNNLLRMQDKTTTLWPNDYLELQLPDGLDTYPDVALEPRQDSLSCEHLKAFRQGTYRNIAGYIRVPNVSCAPVNVTKNMHLFNATPVVPVEDILPDNELPTQDTLPAHIPEPQPFSDSVQLDPDNILNSTQRYRMSSMLQDFDNVFNTDFPGYNGAVGPIHAVVNMGPAQPPQRKGRLPLYGRNRLVELQQKLDELEAHGVISTPESADTVVEYINPSFLVNKPKGGHRLVTAFTDVAKYCKPQPSLLPNVNQVMRQIACWKYLIVSDLTSAYHQIPLHPSSRKYCGIVTPFKGIRVYCRSAMGMPGSETALEELMPRTLGDLLMRGMVAKIADDLYCGGNTYEELLTNWSAVLTALQSCDLRLSPSKTIICPAKTTILGWHWDQGKISASHHTLCTLSTTPPPPSVTALRSFIGSYKALPRVIPGTSVLLGPLDYMVAGRSSSDMIQWTDDQLSVFRKAQQGLKSHQAVVLPRPDDELWLVTDAAVRPTGIGATLFIRRDNNTRVAGFFSCKLKKYQRQWLPCELEALAITSALKHFKPYLIQTTMPAFILTDSKRCVEAVEKLRRGEFSYSPRVSTFLAAVSQFPITVKHISGKYNLSTDFASRHPLDCADSHCQICSFVHALSEEPVVNTATVSPDTDLNNPIYTSRSAWSTIQSSCPSLRRVFAHLKQGTRPSKKETHIPDIKSYLAKATITTDGLLVVPNRDMFGMTRDRIIVPRNVVHGLTTAIHLKLGHPSQHQLKAVMSRYFYALGMDTVIQKVTAACDQCAALKCHIPVPPTFTTQPPPQTILATFAADVMKRARQNILVVRECSTSYTSTQIVPDETSTALRDGLITLCVPLCPLDGPPAVIRCDPAPGFQALTQDTWLAENHLQIEIGEFKNINKNPVAERAIEEMREELCKVDPLGQPVSPAQLAVITARVNAKVRSNGLSSREYLFQRDQFNGEQIPLSDKSLLAKQNQRRLDNHTPSSKSKASTRQVRPAPLITVGDLVYLHADRDKSQARNRYIVTAVNRDFVHISKFIGRQLRSRTYKVRPAECYLVPSQVSPQHRHPTYSETDSDEDDAVSDEHENFVVPPDIPATPPAVPEQNHHQNIPAPTGIPVTPPAVPEQNLQQNFPAPSEFPATPPAVPERTLSDPPLSPRRVESSKETLMIVDGAAPLSYPVRGLTVVPEGTAELPGLAVLDETARQEYEVQLQTTDYGVLDTVAEVALAQLEGLRTKSLTIRSKSLSRLNRQLQFIVYTNTVYDIDATEIITFRYLQHRVSIPLRIRVRTVPFLYDPGPDNDISRKITIITKTFIRYASIRKLLSSIRKFYPNIRVVVADDSRPVEDLQAENVDHFVMPFAAGWFAGRNLAVSQVTTPYLLWVDDDFVFVPETKLENLLEVLENTKLDLVAGTVGRTGIRFTEKMDIVPGDENGDCLRIHDLHHWGPVPGFPQCRLSTRVINFFLARTDSVRAVGFDPVYTRIAHTQFFMAAIGRLRVASCDHARIDHVSDKPAEYKKFRNAGGDQKKVRHRHEFFKHNIQCWVNR